jgi:Flp pilus assembly protein TadG
MIRRRGHGKSRQRGQSLVEFTAVAITLCAMLLSTIEIARLILVYTAVANSVRAGARYAVVHGSSRTGSGVDGPSGPGNNPSQVLTVVRDFAGTGLMDTNRLAVTVEYPGASNSPGQTVNVTAVYVYDPLTRLIPFSVHLGSTTQGVIEY